jgi:hypothetical protein
MRLCEVTPANLTTGELGSTPETIHTLITRGGAEFV